MQVSTDTIQSNFSLKHFNTFGLDCTAGAFLRLDNPAELSLLPELISRYENYLILGGGSNLLLPDYFDGLVVQIALDKLQTRESDSDVLVNAGGGLNWHELVAFCVKENYGGIENLALIPGSTGAAPIQNIGAYGVELKDVFVCLNAFDLQTGEYRCFNREEMEFGYRDSVLKGRYKGRFIIADVWLKLTTRDHRINTSYGALAGDLEKKGVENPGISDVFKAVVEVRKSKLPDPGQIGNAGSFFKNPVVDAGTLESIQKKHSDVVFFELQSSGMMYKIPAGWLIERCGFKGKLKGPVGCYEKQALVLVNRGGAKSSDLVTFAGEVQRSVAAEFGIFLEPEVNIVQPENYGDVISL